MSTIHINKNIHHSPPSIIHTNHYIHFENVNIFEIKICRTSKWNRKEKADRHSDIEIVYAITHSLFWLWNRFFSWTSLLLLFGETCMLHLNQSTVTFRGLVLFHAMRSLHLNTLYARSIWQSLKQRKKSKNRLNAFQENELFTCVQFAFV